jgi:hypothetical protein
VRSCPPWLGALACGHSRLPGMAAPRCPVACGHSRHGPSALVCWNPRFVWPRDVPVTTRVSVAVWPRCLSAGVKAKGAEGNPGIHTPTVVCQHVRAHTCRFSLTSCDSSVHTHVTFKVCSPHAVPTQELKNIREAEIRREIIFFWLPAALHLSSFVFYNEAMAPLTALNALLFGWTRAL